MSANIKNKSGFTLFNRAASAICGVALLASSGFMYARSAVAEGGAFPASDVAAKAAKVAYYEELDLDGQYVYAGTPYFKSIRSDAVECYVLSDVGSPRMAAVILPDSDYVYGFDVYAYRDYKSAKERDSKASDGWVFVDSDVPPGAVVSLPSYSEGVKIKAYDGYGEYAEIGSGTDMGIVFGENGRFSGRFSYATLDYNNCDDYDGCIVYEEDGDGSCFISTATRPEGYVGQTLVKSMAAGIKSFFHLKK